MIRKCDVPVKQVSIEAASLIAHDVAIYDDLFKFSVGLCNILWKVAPSTQPSHPERNQASHRARPTSALSVDADEALRK